MSEPTKGYTIRSLTSGILYGEVMSKEHAERFASARYASDESDDAEVVEVELVTADRLRALESLVRAADRMATHDRLFCTDESADDLDNYRTQRAAVGEIEEE